MGSSKGITCLGVRVGVRVGVGGWGVIRVGVEGNWVGPVKGGEGYSVLFAIHPNPPHIPLMSFL